MSEPAPLTTEDRQAIIEVIREDVEDIVAELECDAMDEEHKADIALGVLQSCDQYAEGMQQLRNAAVSVLLEYLGGHPCESEAERES